MLRLRIYLNNLAFYCLQCLTVESLIQHLDLVVNKFFLLSGACEGTLACSTCHLILSKSDYDRLPEKPTDEELDMLDLAYELTDT